ncbi:MAG: hypothetical protein ACTHP8_01575 [Bosea sp. (in: a-proteobacteria)]|uniref:hypothetical protein n=1 Tax=Bosea sp. (in: a-proteobacteria) TaxID=1871050 RepID=UPI003F7BBEAE
MARMVALIFGRRAARSPSVLPARIEISSVPGVEEGLHGRCRRVEHLRFGRDHDDIGRGNFLGRGIEPHALLVGQRDHLVRGLGVDQPDALRIDVDAQRVIAPPSLPVPIRTSDCGSAADEPGLEIVIE